MSSKRYEERELTLEIIEYDDPAWSEQQFHFGEACGIVHLMNAGIVVHEDDKKVTLASDINIESRTSRHHVSIPKVCITSRKVYKRWKV